MAEQHDLGISWCHYTFNPWHGCWKIADECKLCYAEAQSDRFHPGLWGRMAPRRFFGDAHWHQLAKWNRAAKNAGEQRRVFVGSMCDWAEEHPRSQVNTQMNAARRRLFDAILECPYLDFLLLTKRIASARRLLPWMVTFDRGDDAAPIPWPNVWLGVTAGTRASMLRVVPELREIAAAVRFISCEPILEDISDAMWDAALGPDGGGRVDWLIIGDESGHGRRPAQLEWVRRARDAARRHNVALHLKQLHLDDGAVQGERSKRGKIHLPILDGSRWAEFPEVRRG